VYGVTQQDQALLEGNNSTFFNAWRDALEGRSMEKDNSKPDGDTCRPDGTLKEASEMEWPHSPSDLDAREQGSSLKRKLPINEDDSDDEENGLPKAKVTYSWSFVVEIMLIT
jgi:hypothetical protein